MRRGVKTIISMAVDRVRRLFPRTRNLRSALQNPGLRLSDRDFISLFDVNGGFNILGITGSGKTSGSGMTLANAYASLIGGASRSGGLVLCAKPGDAAMWKGILAKAGRSDDLVIFEPSNCWRFNILDYELRNGGHTHNIVQLIFTIGETLRASNSGRSNQEYFWRQQQELELSNAVVVVRLATGEVSAPLLQRFISEAATNPEQIRSEAFRSSFHSQCLEAAFAAKKTSLEQRDFDGAADYWLRRWPQMADRTRSSIDAGVMGLLHLLNTGILYELLSTKTNISPDDLFAGKWIVVDMSPSQYGDLGSFVCAAWKYLAQRSVLRRDAKASDGLVCIWCDEAHLFVNSFDPTYLAQCRSHLGCMVYLSQSLPGYYTSFKGDVAEHEAQSLLANFSYTILHTVDPETAEWAAKKLGRRREALFGGSMTPSSDHFEELFGQQRMTGSFSEHYEYVLQPNTFMYGLRTGGARNGGLVDGYVIRSGEPFSTGENYLRTTFKQG